LRKRKPITERKEEVFLAITEIIAEKGFSEVSTTEVAKKLGVSQPAIYKYFRSKDEMISYFLKQLKSILWDILEKAEGKETTEEKLETVWREHVKLIEKTRILPRIIFSDTLHTGENREKLKDVVFFYQNGVKKIFEEGIKKGELIESDPDVLTRLFLGGILFSALKWLLSGESYNLMKDIEKVFKTFKKTCFKEK